MIITAGKTNVTVDVYFVDDDGGTAPGEPTTGKLFSDIETGGSASYHRQGTVRVDFELFTQTVAGAHTDGGFIEIDATNMPGLYRLDVPDAAFVTGADYVVIQLVMASGNNSIMRPLLIDLTDVDLRDSVRGGMTALPNAAAEAAGGLYTQGSGAGQINQQANGQIDANVERWLNTAVTAATAGKPDVNVNLISQRLVAADILGRWLNQGAFLTADSGTATTLVDAALTEVDDHWNGSLLVFHSGTHDGRTAIVTDFDNVSATLTFTPALPSDVTTEDYVLVPGLGWSDVRAWLGTVPNALISGAVDADVSAMQNDVMTAAALATDAVNEIRDSILSDSTPFAGAEITAARMAALTDWIDGGRLDLILDIIAADVVNIDGATMRGTDSALLAANVPSNFADMSITVTTGLVDITQAAADKVWGTAARVLTANTNFNDPTAAAIANAVWDEPIEDHDTQGNTGWSVALGVYAGSDGPGIYIDSGAANTNTVVGTDGTEINPVSTFAAARTIAAALGLKIYYLEGNSDITLAATHVDWEFIGLGSVLDNIVNLGSQDVSRSLFRNLAVEGTQGGTGRITTRDCALQDPGAGDTTLHIFAERCGFVDRIQVDTSNDNVFDQCYSLVAGTAAPVIQVTGASGTISVRHYSGGLEFESLSASHNVTWEGIGQVIFNANCNVNANVSVRGIGSITDNTAGMASLTETSLMNMTKVNAEADTALADYDPPTRTEATSDKDSIEANIAALNDYDPTAQMTESYAANGVAPTRDQCMFAIHQMLMQFGISGTNLTVRKLDDATTAFVVTLDDETNPTNAKRV